METNNSNTPSITYDTVYRLIENSLSNNSITRAASEQRLTSLINSHKTKLIQILLNILTQQQTTTTNITQMAAVVVKNILMANTTWFTFTSSFQKEIVLSLYALIHASPLETEANKHSCIILANIAYIEYKSTYYGKCKHCWIYSVDSFLIPCIETPHRFQEKSKTGTEKEQSITNCPSGC